MPEVTFSPLSQCLPSDGADDAYAPTEPGLPAFINPLECLDQAAGAEGRGGTDCADELVRQHQDDSCVDEALRALGSCGSAGIALLGKDAIEASLALASCAGAVGALVQCATGDDSVR